MNIFSRASMRGTLMIAGGIAATLALGYFQSRVILESRSNGHTFLQANLRGDTVKLTRKLSDAPCIFGESWGYDQRGIWVDKGCRAEFEVKEDSEERRHDWSRDRRNEIERDGEDWHVYSSGIRKVRLESSNDRRAYILVDASGGVQLLRQLSVSPCIFNQTWGYRRDRIWVDEGCRAVFQIDAPRHWDR